MPAEKAQKIFGQPKSQLIPDEQITLFDCALHFEQG